MDRICQNKNGMSEIVYSHVVDDLRKEKLIEVSQHDIYFIKIKKI